MVREASIPVVGTNQLEERFGKTSSDSHPQRVLNDRDLSRAQILLSTPPCMYLGCQKIIINLCKMQSTTTRSQIAYNK
jgi:hypothetical protein